MNHPQELIDAVAKAIHAREYDGGILPESEYSAERQLFLEVAIAAIGAVREWDTAHPPTLTDAVTVPEDLLPDNWWSVELYREDGVVRADRWTDTPFDDDNMLPSGKGATIIDALKDAALADALGKDG